MTKLSTFGAAAAFAAAVIATPATAQPANWHGTYVYEDEIGPTGGGDTPGAPVAFVEYRLTIGAKGCMITAQGYQTDKQIACTVTPQGKSAVVKFRRYAGTAAPPQYNRFTSGQPLLTLTRGTRGIVTRWQGMQLSNGERPTGAYFRRVG
jgi:Family of unknown function (DUF5991)